MSSEFELVDISNKRRASSSPLDASVGPDLVPLGTTNPENFRESTGASWAWAASGILLSWSCALIFSPRMLLFAIGQSHPILTPLESFLALHFGLLLAFSAVGLVVNIPSAATASAVPERNKEPPAHPLIVPVVSFSLLSAFLSYNTAGAGSLPLFYSACMGLLGIWGLWVVSVAVLKHELARDRNPDLWRWGTTQRSYLQVHEWFLEKLEPTSTRVLSYSATNLLRQNRRSDGNESKRRTVDTLTTLDLCIGVVVRVVE